MIKSINWILKISVVLTLFLIIGFQSLRYNSYFGSFLEIEDERSGLLIHSIISCLCITALFILKKEKLAIGSIFSNQANIFPGWIRGIFSLIFLIIGILCIIAWIEIHFIADNAPDWLKRFRSELAFFLYIMGVFLFSFSSSKILSTKIDAMISYSEKTTLQQKFDWNKISKVINSNQILDSELTQIKKQFDDKIDEVISREVTAYLKTFDFSEGFWTKNYHGNEIITQSIDFIREEYFSGWAGIEKEKAQDDLAKYINTDFRKKTISSKQLSLYSNEYLSYERHRSPSLVVIRNLLCFHNEENDELTSLSTLSRYFVTQISNVENSDADNNHYFQMKMAIATFFAVGLRKYAQEIHSNQDIINQDFNYDMYKLLIEISMENSERTECPTLSTVGLIQSKQFTEISRFSTPNHQNSNLATYFDDVELLMERLGRYLRQISLYGYTFPNLSVALHKAELNPEFWEKFWESLNWKRGG